MSLVGVFIGSFFQMIFAYFLFMVVAFSAGGAANGRSLEKMQVSILNSFLYILPSLCILSAGIIVFLYFQGGSIKSYWWHVLPVAGFILYLVYIFKFV